MDYGEFVRTLPSNQMYRFDDISDFLETYSRCYPPEQERQEIYETEVWIRSF
jgi:hypothetical protein